MSRKDVYEIVSAIVPCAHMAWRRGSAPQLPWAVYMEDGTDGMYADDTVYAKSTRWRVELYQRAADEELEAALESAIEEAFGPYSRYESWIESENCLLVAFEFTEI